MIKADLTDAQSLMAMAAEARRGGRVAEAEGLLRRLLDSAPGHAPALNTLGLLRLGAGDAGGAVLLLRQAAEADPNEPALWLNLAAAHRGNGRPELELAALDRALALDPYLLPALLAKGVALRQLGRVGDAVVLYRDVLHGLPEAGQLPPAFRSAVEEARAFVRSEGERRLSAQASTIDEVLAGHSPADGWRARAFVEQVAGRRKVYVQQPTASHFPYLPAVEFFDRALFPWFARLEAAAEDIRAELSAIWSGEEGSRPYVQFDRASPVNQWAELNHSPRWSAWFLMENGVADDANCARCPRTAAVMRSLPLLDMPGKGPNVMFSVLKPRTRIPAHTGSTNVRATVHLPLIVPPGCGFRVGAETRAWRFGEAWAFDDTIEHEAWNDSDEPRAILIVDTWNPLLTEPERAVARLVA